MLIGIFGENCTGKTVLAEQLKNRLDAQMMTGKDYLRLAKNEAIAKKLFQKKLEEAVTGTHFIYVVSEPEQLSLLPDAAIRILVTADLDLICERFARRMSGNLPQPVRAMLERKHGIFDAERHDYRVHNGTNTDEVCDAVCSI